MKIARIQHVSKAVFHFALLCKIEDGFHCRRTGLFAFCCRRKAFLPSDAFAYRKTENTCNFPSDGPVLRPLQMQKCKGRLLSSDGITYSNQYSPQQRSRKTAGDPWHRQTVSMLVVAYLQILKFYLQYNIIVHIHSTRNKCSNQYEGT